MTDGAYAKEVDSTTIAPNKSTVLGTKRKSMINSEVLRAYAERLAKLENVKAEITSDISDVKLEARSKGYDAMLISKVAKLMNLESAKRQKVVEQADLFIDYIEQAGIR